MIDNDLMRQLLRELVAIDSVNPSLVPGARGEAGAAGFLRDFLRRQGIAAELQEAAPGRPNVVAQIGPAAAPSGAGQRRHAALAILAHIDTVGAGDMPSPFTPQERDGRLHGRGALDIKSGVAAMCAAAVAVVRNAVALKHPLLIASGVGEECNSIGTEALPRESAADKSYRATRLNVDCRSSAARCPGSPTHKSKLNSAECSKGSKSATRPSAPRRG